MKKLTYAIALLVAFVFIASCNKSKSSDQGWEVTITGKVGFPKEGNITIKNWSDTTDAVQILDFDRSNYTFNSSVRLTEPGYWRINFFDIQVVDVILNRSNIEVNVDGDKPNGFFEINGSPDIEMFKVIQAIRQNFNSSGALASIESEFNQAVSQKDQQKIEDLQKKYQELLKIPNDSISGLLLKNSPSVGVIEFLTKNELDPDEYFSTYTAVAKTLEGEWSNYTLGKEFLDLYNKMKTLAIGVEAPEISLPNPEGQVVSLSSLRGKYVLVDFWAKWCGPCRQENPNVVRVYNKYRDKGFEVFGVSLDRTKEDWVKAIAEDGLNWTQVSDLKYFNSEAARTYNINAIPFSILIDPQGKIMAKNLRGKSLERKLQEIFKAI